MVTWGSLVWILGVGSMIEICDHWVLQDFTAAAGLFYMLTIQCMKRGPNPKWEPKKKGQPTRIQPTQSNTFSASKLRMSAGFYLVWGDGGESHLLAVECYLKNVSHAWNWSDLPGIFSNSKTGQMKVIRNMLMCGVYVSECLLKNAEITNQKCLSKSVRFRGWLLGRVIGILLCQI